MKKDRTEREKERLREWRIDADLADEADRIATAMLRIVNKEFGKSTQRGLVLAGSAVAFLAVLKEIVDSMKQTGRRPPLYAEDLQADVAQFVCLVLKRMSGSRPQDPRKETVQ